MVSLSKGSPSRGVGLGRLGWAGGRWFGLSQLEHSILAGKKPSQPPAAIPGKCQPLQGTLIQSLAPCGVICAFFWYVRGANPPLTGRGAGEKAGAPPCPSVPGAGAQLLQAGEGVDGSAPLPLLPPDAELL